MTYTPTDSSDQTEVSHELFAHNTQHVHYQIHEKIKRKHIRTESGKNAVAFQWNPLTLLALELLGWDGGSWWVQLATTEKHEPFQQCCNTVSFWFKHTHSRTLSVQHYQILPSAFPRTTGESECCRPSGCPDTPTLFPNDPVHILSIVSIPSPLQTCGVVTSAT